MKTIPVTGGHEAQVDDEDFETLSKYNWCHVSHKGGRSNTIYTQCFISKGRYQMMHRMLLNPPKGTNIDHIDGDGLNNQRANLRFCSQRENSRNCKKIRIGSSRFKGVSFNKSRKRWVSYICPDRKFIQLGYFKSEIEAARAYNEAAKEHFGEFARLNEI